MVLGWRAVPELRKTEESGPVSAIVTSWKHNNVSFIVHFKRFMRFRVKLHPIYDEKETGLNFS